MQTEILIENIEPNPYQTRITFDEEKINELAESIQSVGLLNRILVRPHPENDEQYQLVHGERRLKACKSLGWTQVPSEVRILNDNQLIEISLIENLQREGLNPIEEALGFQIAIEKLELTKVELGKKIGKNPTHITNRLNLLELPEEVQEKLRRLSITPGQAQPLVRYYRQLKKAEELKITPRAHDFLVAKARIHDVKIISASKKPDTAIKYAANRVEKDGIPVKKLREAVGQFEKVIDYKIEERKEQAVTFSKLRSWGLERWIPAIELGEIWVQGDRLVFSSTKKEVRGQDKHFPAYSGQEIENWNEKTPIPIFTQNEWDEVNEYAENLDLIWCELFPEFELRSERAVIRENLICRRTFDPDYGNMITTQKEYFPNLSWEEKTIEHRYFIKKGWGTWKVVTCNNGEGRRIKKRCFEQDWATNSLIEEAIKTVHPEWFSATNYRNLGLFSVQKYEASWAYFRKETIRREDIIKALKQDLEALENVKPLTDEEIQAQIIDFLSDFHEKNGKDGHGLYGHREGSITTKRLSNGDPDLAFHGLLEGPD